MYECNEHSIKGIHPQAHTHTHDCSVSACFCISERDTRKIWLLYLQFYYNNALTLLFFIRLLLLILLLLLLLLSYSSLLCSDSTRYYIFTFFYVVHSFIRSLLRPLFAIVIICVWSTSHKSFRTFLHSSDCYLTQENACVRFRGNNNNSSSKHTKQ